MLAGSALHMPLIGAFLAAGRVQEDTMRRVQGEIVIKRPIDEVFDFVADGRNEPKYNPYIEKAEQLSPGPIGRGTRFRFAAKKIGIRTAYELTAFERPHRIETRVIDSPLMDVHGDETFGDVGGGTRFRWSFEVRPRGVFKLLTPVIARTWGRRLEQAFANLKGLLEAPA